MKKALVYFMLWSCSITVSYGLALWIKSDIGEFSKESDLPVETYQKLSAIYNVNCLSPIEQEVKDIKNNEVTLSWDDSSGTVWEYIVQLPTDPYPTGPGKSSSVKEVTVTKDNNGNNLQPNTAYEFYVRTDCGAGDFSSWLGPFDFKTTCISVNLPFSETFETNSATMDCWTVIDNNKDGTSTSDMWNRYSSASYAHEGSYSMRFYSTGTSTTHDDWLISPVVQMNNTDIYQLTYHYRTNASSDNEFEVKMSTNGIDPNYFTTTLLASDTYKNGIYEKKVLYITGVNGDVNIGWHITSPGTKTYVYLDAIAIEKVDCAGPDENVVISHLEKDNATFTWEDDINTDWQYYVQPAGNGEPVGDGSLTSNKTVTVDATNESVKENLKPDTEYEFWVRSNCGPGKYSPWIGPLLFRTPCDELILPFWEGFNKDSLNINCWMVVDNNGDGSASTGTWIVNNTKYEGDQSMYFRGSSNAINDDWLISPTFTLDPMKIYKLRYHYRTHSSYKNTFRVMLSGQGAGLSDFTHEIVSIESSDNDWIEDIHYIANIDGNINIAWQVNTESTITYLYLDNIFFEEVQGCPEPLSLGAKDEEEDRATIFWKDNLGTDWEYVVQEAGGSIPVGLGTQTKTTEVLVTTDGKGNKLQSNTAYEFYVRSDCGAGDYSIWSGPYSFRMGCEILSTPFWEGFNTDSETIYCWEIIDGNFNAMPTADIWMPNNLNYEGDQSMYFSGKNGITHDDWLISPTIKFDAGKIYRVKYHYRTHTTANFNYEFEVRLSNTGYDDVAKFDKILIPAKSYAASSDWEEEYFFITGIIGNINLAWYVGATGGTRLHLDNVFVEEVQACPEPIGLDVTNIGTNTADISWTDNMGGSKWEYIVQKAGGTVPKGSGTTTSKKENTITKDSDGDNLTPNTDYEFYVRTDCGNGEFSIWSGPYTFATLCDVFLFPFWEGFNTDSKSLRCWTVIDNNGDAAPAATSNLWRSNTVMPYEGDQLMYFYGTSGKTHDDWLISPAIQANPGTYILKYHYKSNIKDNNEFEVLLSDHGTNVSDFKTQLLPAKVYQDAAWQEEVITFTVTSGTINIAWHAMSTGSTYIYIDNITLKKVETCPEPYYVEVTNETATNIDVEWQQDGGITNWEVIVVEYGEDETAIPVQAVNVTGKPEATLNNLQSGKAYRVYVRAICSDGNSTSYWSTPVTAVTSSTNDTCDNAINIPVNTDTECIQKVSASLYKSTESNSPLSDCNGMIKKDIWFEFTAINETHMLKVSNLKSILGLSPSVYVYGALYDQPCGSSVTTALTCFTLADMTLLDMGEFKVFKDLIPGNKYYIRLGTNMPDADIMFDLCITSSQYLPLEISPSGDKYSADELIKDVLVNTECDLVSNVKLQAADGSTSINTLGYFNKGNSIFPFEEGIVLATHAVDMVSGPYDPTLQNKQKVPKWFGDPDLNEVIDGVGGAAFGTDKYVSVLEFDFIPIKDSLKFEYIFASESYVNWCVYSCRAGGALFAAWVTDLSTGEGENLAVVPNTDLPIALSSIRDKDRADLTCESVNPEYYWKHYGNGDNDDDPLEAPINYIGVTVPMSSETIYVKPGNKYRIKLAIADFCSVGTHTSAVFFNAGSFDIGNVDLGDDLLIETNTALCKGETALLQSYIPDSEDIKKEITWYKDGVLIPGIHTSDLEVSESGEYTIKVDFVDLECSRESTVKVEIYPAISKVVHQAENIVVCKQSLQETVVDLTTVENAMFAAVDRSIYATGYYTTAKDAEATENAILNEENYVLSRKPQAQTLYIRVENTETGCYEVFELHIQSHQGAVPDQPENVSVCAEYIFPETAGNQYYYTESGGQGTAYQPGDILAEPGEHTIYLLQINSEQGCYEETAYKVNITAPVTADIFEDKTLSCEYYMLKPLSEYNQYFTEPERQGNELNAGMQILKSQTIYVYASSEDGLCTDESSFTIDYEDCPIPRGISPNNDGLNDFFDLTPHSVESIKIYNRWGTEVYSHGGGYTTQWHGQSTSGKQLPDGTYYYVIQAHGKTRTGWVQINK